jgi:hypothetical protein
MKKPRAIAENELAGKTHAVGVLQLSLLPKTS